jgi:septum formation protein
MAKLPPIVLASKSPRRVELLRQFGLEFVAAASNAIEMMHEDLTAAELCQINAFRKARAVARKHPDALVLGADTLVAEGRTVLGKPASLVEARRMLERLQGRTHQVVTGVCLLHLRGHRCRIFADISEVKFRPLTAVGIQRYLKLCNPLDKAGAYAIQEHGDEIVEGIRGSYTNVVGLPMERLADELEAWR